jgi:membrane associated rhomboid family serine protease
MVPIRDENPTLRAPVVTLALIAANVVVWLLVEGAGAAQPMLSAVCSLALVPGELTGRAASDTIDLGPALCVLPDAPRAWTLVSSMFLHGGWLHLIGNMWFLWVFGNNVEDAMGRWRFLAFYLACGLCAAGAQILTGPSSMTPMLGASGAIGGVMGAYVALYPRVRVQLLVFLGFFITTVWVPAFLMLGYWVVVQVLSALVADQSAGGVAFAAHVGGFLAGLALVVPFRSKRLLEQHRRTFGPETWYHRQR